CSACKLATCSVAEREADVISCTDLLMASPAARAPGLELRNLAHYAGFLSRQICKRPADRDGFHNRDPLALFNVVSGAHKHLRDASLKGRRDSHSLAQNQAVGAQQHA